MLIEITEDFYFLFFRALPIRYVPNDEHHSIRIMYLVSALQDLGIVVEMIDRRKTNETDMGAGEGAG